MNVSISQDSQQFVELQLAAGRFSSAAEVVDYAIRRLSRQPPRTKEELLARLAESRRQLDEGEYVEFNSEGLRELRDQMKELARSAANGESQQ